MDQQAPVEFSEESQVPRSRQPVATSQSSIVNFFRKFNIQIDEKYIDYLSVIVSIIAIFVATFLIWKTLYGRPQTQPTSDYVYFMLHAGRNAGKSAPR